MIRHADDYERWQTEVRGPATANAEPTVRLRHGREEADYTLAPIPGGWAWTAHAYVSNAGQQHCPGPRGAVLMIPAAGRNGLPGTNRRPQEVIDTLGRPSSRPNASSNPTEGRLMQDHLLSPLVTAHCFWWPSCKHTVTDRPQAAHDAMESHYADTPEHQAWLRKKGF